MTPFAVRDLQDSWRLSSVAEDIALIVRDDGVNGVFLTSLTSCPF